MCYVYFKSTFSTDLMIAFKKFYLLSDVFFMVHVFDGMFPGPILLLDIE